MLFALGAASSALDAIQSLTSSDSSSPQPDGLRPRPRPILSIIPGSAPTAAESGRGVRTERIFADIAGHHERAAGGAKPVVDRRRPHPASTDPSGALQDLFSQIDANGDGQISKSEFENALGAGGTNLAQADDVFNKLDTNGDGSVSLDELTSALKGAGGKGGQPSSRACRQASGGITGASGRGSSADGASSDPLLQALQGASATRSPTATARPRPRSLMLMAPR